MVGGFEDVRPSRAAEVFDPDSGRWFGIADMTQQRMGHTATHLDDGLIMVAGGRHTSVELLDLLTGKWILGGNFTDARQQHTATLLRDGSVLFIGGEGTDSELLASVERFTP